MRIGYLRLAEGNSGVLDVDTFSRFNNRSFENVLRCFGCENFFKWNFSWISLIWWMIYVFPSSPTICIESVLKFNLTFPVGRYTLLNSLKFCCGKASEVWGKLLEAFCPKADIKRLGQFWFLCFVLSCRTYISTILLGSERAGVVGAIDKIFAFRPQGPRLDSLLFGDLNVCATFFFA